MILLSDEGQLFVATPLIYISDDISTSPQCVYAMLCDCDCITHVVISWEFKAMFHNFFLLTLIIGDWENEHFHD